MPKTRKPAFTWNSVSREDQLKVLEIFGDDGHGILDADRLRESSGLPASVIDTFTSVETSDNSYKGSIFSSETGERLTELRGIYCLTVIRSLARHYGLTSNKFGRGSESRELTQKLNEKLGMVA